MPWTVLTSSRRSAALPGRGPARELPRPLYLRRRDHSSKVGEHPQPQEDGTVVGATTGLQPSQRLLGRGDVPTEQRSAGQPCPQAWRLVKDGRRQCLAVGRHGGMGHRPQSAHPRATTAARPAHVHRRVDERRRSTAAPARGARLLPQRVQPPARTERPWPAHPRRGTGRRPARAPHPGRRDASRSLSSPLAVGRGDGRRQLMSGPDPVNLYPWTRPGRLRFGRFGAAGAGSCCCPVRDWARSRWPSGSGCRGRR